MRIIGIDPGIALTGFGIVDHKESRTALVEYGCIRTKAGYDVAARLDTIYRDIQAIILKLKPDVMAVEKIFFNRNVSSAMQVGEARGVVMLAGGHFHLPIYEYTPLQVKQAVVGYGRAEKQQVQHMIRVILSLSAVPAPDDAADALAIAICHGHSRKMQSILERRKDHV